MISLGRQETNKKKEISMLKAKDIKQSATKVLFVLSIMIMIMTVSYNNGFSRGKEELAMDQYELDLSSSKGALERRQELRKLKKENYQLQYRNQYLEYWFDNVTCVCGCSDTETEQDLSL
jgi:Tfp pilus assembly protein PilO